MKMTARTDALSRWLMKTDARVVFTCALVALVLTVGYWAWRLSRPLDADPLSWPNGRENPLATLDIMSFVNRQTSSALPGGRFATADLDQDYEKDPGETEHAPRDENEDEDKDEDDGQEGPVREAAPVELTYLGIFDHKNGEPLANIEDSQSGRPRFYGVGAVVFGATVQSIAATEAEVVLPGGSLLKLKFGEPRAILD